MAAEVMPQIFRGVQFRRLGRQMHQRDILRNTQRSGDVPAGAVQNHRRMDVRRQFTRELLQKSVHHVGVDVWRDQAAGVAGFGTDGAKDVQIVILRLPDRPRPRADPRPDPRDCAVLSEARFVLVIAQDPLIGMGRANLSQFFGQIFF